MLSALGQVPSAARCSWRSQRPGSSTGRADGTRALGWAPHADVMAETPPGRQAAAQGRGPKRPAGLLACVEGRCACSAAGSAASSLGARAPVQDSGGEPPTVAAAQLAQGVAELEKAREERDEAETRLRGSLARHATAQRDLEDAFQASRRATRMVEEATARLASLP